MDNYATHKRPKIKAWLAANPRIHVHFTPTSGSWLNLVEVWFGIIERQAIHRGSFTSVADLMVKIRAFINGWNHRTTRPSGPNPPTTSSPKSNVNVPGQQATSNHGRDHTEPGQREGSAHIVNMQNETGIAEKQSAGHKTAKKGKNGGACS